MKRSVLPIFTHALYRKAALATLVALAAVIAIVGSSRFEDASVFAERQGRDEVRIVLSSNGFTPSEAQHAPGTFAIAVENNTLPGEYLLKLKAEDGTVLNELQVQKGSSAWTVSLQTARYTLSEANHPEWVCSIVVQ